MKESIGTANSRGGSNEIVRDVYERRGRGQGDIVCSAMKIRQVQPNIPIGVARFEVSYVSDALAAAQMLSSNTPGL